MKRTHVGVRSGVRSLLVVALVTVVSACGSSAARTGGGTTAPGVTPRSATVPLPSLPLRKDRIAQKLLATSGNGSSLLGHIDPPPGVLVFEITCEGPSGVRIQSIPRARFGFFTSGPCAGEIKTWRFTAYHGGRIGLSITAPMTHWKVYVGVAAR